MIESTARRHLVAAPNPRDSPQRSDRRATDSVPLDLAVAISMLAASGAGWAVLVGADLYSAAAHHPGLPGRLHGVAMAMLCTLTTCAVIALAAARTIRAIDKVGHQIATGERAFRLGRRWAQTGVGSDGVDDDLTPPPGLHVVPRMPVN
jgi:hypothetical protein